MTTGRSPTRIVLVELAGTAETARGGKAGAGPGEEAVPGAVTARVARALRDQGAEVIHAGAVRSLPEIAAAVEQEDPAVVLFVAVPGNVCEGNVRDSRDDSGDDAVNGKADNAIARSVRDSENRDSENADNVGCANNADICSGGEIAEIAEIVDRARALFDDRRVAVIATDTDVANWVKASAICATGPSSEGCR
ncbi:hypothetical protein ABZ639_32300 [Saccharomonospora sp. NPDC006951]